VSFCIGRDVRLGRFASKRLFLAMVLATILAAMVLATMVLATAITADRASELVSARSASASGGSDKYHLPAKLSTTGFCVWTGLPPLDRWIEQYKVTPGQAESVCPEQ
jgi:hypothetical protein